MIDVAKEQNWLENHKNETDFSWKNLAGRIGVAESTLSMFPNGKYAGRMEPIAEKVAAYRQTLEAQIELATSMPTAPGFFETRTSRQITGYIKIAHSGRMTIVAGSPGTSKTSVAKDYCAANSNVFFATMKKTTKNIATMQLQVLRAIGVNDAKGAPLLLTHRIERFFNEHPGSLLIVDEAHHLSEDALEEIRSWHDETGVGVCLIGNSDVLTRLTLGTKRDELERLASRIRHRYIFRAPHEEDALALADAWSVQAPKQRQFLVERRLEGGGLRTCTAIIEMAHMLASQGGEPLALEDLQTAWAQLSMRGGA